MSAHARKAQVSLLNDGIGILDKKAVGTYLAKEVFETATTILAMVQVGAPALGPSANAHFSLT